jgi:AraC-like DNA-binding protein
MTHSDATAHILVAHACPLVSAGLVSILQRMPGCVVRAWQRETLPEAEIVFGDVEFLAGLIDRRQDAAVASRSKLVVVAEDETDNAAPALDGVDGWLPIQCGEDDLFETVIRLRDQRPRQVSRTSNRGGMAPGALRRVKEAIERRSGEAFTLCDLAAIAGLSEGHFARAFKQSVGLPPHRYVIRHRVHAAADMMQRTDLPLTEISLSTGFSDQSHFTRTFVREMGETPSCFRRRHR